MKRKRPFRNALLRVECYALNSETSLTEFLVSFPTGKINAISGGQAVDIDFSQQP